MIKILDTIDYKSIRDYYFSIENSIIWKENIGKGKQTSIQYVIGGDPWLSSNGRDMGDQNRFDQLNPFFHNSIMEKIINKFSLTRSRLMWLDKQACYTMHKDITPRIHIPIISNPDCYFLFKDQAPIYLEPGYVFWVDTTKEHTALNCSLHGRLHFVGATDNENLCK